MHGKAGTANAELHPAIAALNIEHHFKKGQYSPSYSGFEGFETTPTAFPPVRKSPPPWPRAGHSPTG